MSHHGWLALATVVPLLLNGCNKQASSPPPTSAAPPSSPPPATTAAAPSAPQQNAGTAAQKPAPAAGKSRPLPDVPESHKFQVGADIPNLVPIPASDPRSGALVSLVEPPIGFDSTMVVLEAPREATRATTGGTPAGFSVVADAGYAEDGLPQRIRCEKDGSEMVRVPAGLFLQGADNTDTNAGPKHPVELSGYYIDVHEVTVEQYLKYWKETRPVPGRAANEKAAGRMPVLGISWRDADGYLESVGKELPTEAEWEKAARGPNEFAYPWGNGRVLWHMPRTPEQIDLVGSFPADRSIYGVFDMAGNAREWCADFYADDAYQQAAGSTGAVVQDWKGPKSGSPPSHRVVRGNAPGWQLWHRSSSPMLAPAPDLGFRGVLHWPPTSGGGAAAAATDSSEPPATTAPRRERRRGQ